jgi:pimeloyl-ACP methyl ester carboxylesterase
MTAFARSPDGVPIAYDVAGAGAPALVFVHGWSCDRTYWRGQVEPFALRHRVVAVDLAGHGESGESRSSWTMPAFGDDVVAVVDQLQLNLVVLVGHSMGGDVIVDAARRLPGRVAGLVWVDTYDALETPDPDEKVTRFLVPFREDFGSATRGFARGMFGPHSDPDLVEWVAGDMAAAPRELALAALEHAVTNDRVIPALLAELALPVTAINSDRWPTDADGLAQHGVRTVIAAGLGHFPMLEDPSAFNLLLAGVVESLQRL